MRTTPDRWLLVMRQEAHDGHTAAGSTDAGVRLPLGGGRRSAPTPRRGGRQFRHRSALSRCGTAWRVAGRRSARDPSGTTVRAIRLLAQPMSSSHSPASAPAVSGGTIGRSCSSFGCRLLQQPQPQPDVRRRPVLQQHVQPRQAHAVRRLSLRGGRGCSSRSSPKVCIPIGSLRLTMAHLNPARHSASRRAAGFKRRRVQGLA